MTTTVAKDIEILRYLAQEVKRISELPEQAIRRKRLCDLNSLKNDRPVVLCHPEGAWTELLPDSILQCEDGLYRWWEMQLRQTIYQWEVIKDDSAVNDVFTVPWSFSPGDFGVHIPFSHGDQRGSYAWDPPIKDLATDFSKLKYRQPSVNKKETNERLEKAHEIFEGILKPQIRAPLWWTTGLTYTATSLVGLENFMVLTLLEPEGMHTFMAWLRDEQLHFMDWCEKEGILTLNNGADLVGSGGWGFTDELPKSNAEIVLLSDLWGLSESQESVGVSPELFGEFIFPYQLPVIEKFGLSCYGCCEGLHERIDYILKIPNLRRISVSPWADQAKMAEKINGKYIFSRKPNPSEICLTFNEESIRNDIRTTLDLAGSGSLEFIMKDTHTVNNEPWRISKWVAIALEEVDRYMSKE